MRNYLLASADWMPRNPDRRIEIAFPVLDPAVQAQIREILDILDIRSPTRSRRGASSLTDTPCASGRTANPLSAPRSASTRRTLRAGSPRSPPGSRRLFDVVPTAYANHVFIWRLVDERELPDAIRTQSAWTKVH
jgi:hypothetical protein